MTEGGAVMTHYAGINSDSFLTSPDGLHLWKNNCLSHAYLHKANVSLPFHNSGNHLLVLCEIVLLGGFDVLNLVKRSAQRHNDFLNALHTAQGC